MSLAGSSVSLPLPDLIQATAYSGRTCRVMIETDLGELGFDRGELVAARWRELVGDAAVLELLALPYVTYHMDVAPPERRDVVASWQQLVLESARLHDEATRAARRRTSASGAQRLLLPLPSPATPAPEPVASPARPPRMRRWLVAITAATLAAVAVVAGTAALEARRASSATAHGGAAPGAATAPNAAADDATAAVAIVEASALTGPGDAAPTAIDAPLPATPAGARAGLAPTIVCRVRVAADGRVAEAHTYRARPELAPWEAVALATVQRWRFTPPRRAQLAVSAWLNVPVSFAAQPAPARTIVVKGSDTIGGEHGAGPVLAAAYEAAHPDTHVAWEGLGSATAFVGLLDGSADIGASSRPVATRELEEAERLGVRLTEYVLGYDGIAVIVHPSAPVRALTTAQLGQVFRGELATWRALAVAAGVPDAAAVPDAPIRRIARPTYSGTHAFFRDKVLGGVELDAGVELIEASEAIVAAIAADPHAISFVGMGWITPAVRALGIGAAAGAAPIAPDAATVRDGSYPIARPLLLYVRGLPTPPVAELLRYCLGADGQALVASRGFVPGDTPIEAVIAAAPATAPTTAPTIALRVTFATGQVALDDDARRALAALAAELRGAPRAVTLIGHADAERGGGSNATLARQRAEAVAAVLRTHGVDGRLLRVDSAGDAAPVATNRTRSGRDQNRRVDVLLAAP